MSSFIVIVDFRVRPGKLERFRQLVIGNADASVRGERGCRQFDVVLPRGEADRVLLYEVYDDEAAFEIHKRTPHFADFDRETGPLVKEKTVTIGERTFDGHKAN